MSVITADGSTVDGIGSRAARVGDRIAVRIDGGGVERFVLVDPDEALSVSSPIGSAVAGAAAGAVFEVRLPGERVAFVEVVAVG